MAFLAVLTVHVGQKVVSLPGERVVAAGKYGVQLFFLLSAITLIHSLSVRSGTERYPLCNFFVRRIFRIAPLFWFGIAFYLLLDGVHPRFWAPEGLGFWHLLITAFFLHGWAPVTLNSVVPGGWSIAVEMTFYILLPLLFSRIKGIYSAISWFFYFLLFSIGIEYLIKPYILQLVSDKQQYLVPHFFFHWFPSQFPVFLIGFIVFFCLQNKAILNFLYMPGRAALFVIISLFVLISLSGVTSWFIPLHILYSFAFAGLIIALAVNPFRIIVNPVISGIGKISYSCYITHWVALGITGNFFASDSFAFLPARLAALCHFSVYWVAALVLTIVASIFIYLLIEKPGIRIGSLLISRYEKPTTSIR